MHIYSFNDLKFTLKHLKRSYMFRSYDHPQGAYFVPCWSYIFKTLSDLNEPVRCATCSLRVNLTLHVAQRTSIARLILSSIQLTQYTRHPVTAPTQRNDVNHWVFLNYNFSKEQGMLPEDDRMIEICRSVLSVLISILDHYMNICAFVGVLIK